MILSFDVLLIQNANGLVMLWVLNTIFNNNVMVLNISFVLWPTQRKQATFRKEVIKLHTCNRKT